MQPQPQPCCKKELWTGRTWAMSFGDGSPSKTYAGSFNPLQTSLPPTWQYAGFDLPLERCLWALEVGRAEPLQRLRVKSTLT